MSSQLLKTIPATRLKLTTTGKDLLFDLSLHYTVIDREKEELLEKREAILDRIRKDKKKDPVSLLDFYLFPKVKEISLKLEKLGHPQPGGYKKYPLFQKWSDFNFVNL